MKKVINGSRYDTDTAKFLCSEQYSNRGDFHFWCESLYRTKAGKFFIHGEGGPMSKYCRQTGLNEWSGDEVIKPISEGSARAFAENNMDADEFEAAFGAVGEPTAITVQLPDTLLAELDARKDKSRSEVVIAALKAYFAAEGK